MPDSFNNNNWPVAQLILAEHQYYKTWQTMLWHFQEKKGGVQEVSFWLAVEPFLKQPSHKGHPCFGLVAKEIWHQRPRATPEFSKFFMFSAYIFQLINPIPFQFHDWYFSKREATDSNKRYAYLQYNVMTLINVLKSQQKCSKQVL